MLQKQHTHKKRKFAYENKGFKMNYLLFQKKKNQAMKKKKSTEAAILFLFLTRLKRGKQFKASSGLDKKEKRGPQKSPLPGRTQTFPGVLINSNLICKSQQEMSKAALFHKLC